MAQTKKILVVDDDTTFLMMLQGFLNKKGYETSVESSAEKGLEKIHKTSFDLIISDYRMPGMDGIELLAELRKNEINTPLILLTSYGDIKLAVRTMKLGASDYLTKPVNPEELLRIVNHTLNQSDKNLTTVNTTAERKPANKTSNQSAGREYVPGVSAQTRQLNEHIKLVGPTNMSVLIQGESGTGKEYVAQQIHLYSKRNQEPFVAIDCGSLSRELAASELFGHIKGSFTGAATDKTGQFELANGGTLFLDEIGNLSYEIQVQLLRAIQEKVIRKVGGQKDIPVNVRLIAATNENLQEAIQDGEFREDLYHRLNEFKLELSPLRARREEVEQFALHFLKLANEELEKDVSGFDTEAFDLLKNYSWPGNLRELKNVVKRSVLLTSGDKIQKSALPSEVLHQTDEAEDMRQLKNTTDLKKLESVMERQKIMQALEQVRYNKTKAAHILNIDRKTLYNKIKQYGLEL